MSSPAPLIVTAAECPEIAIGPDGAEGAVRELIGRGHGSGVLLGTFRLGPGQCGEFSLPSETGTKQEMYYLLAGRLRVRWKDGDSIAAAGQAILFPSGERYFIETVGSTPVELLWTAYPAPSA